MTVHIVKLCVGTDSIDDLADWQKRRMAEAKKAGRVDAKGRGEVWHTTRMFPRRRDDVLDGGSLYWVIRRVIQVRQRITDLRPVRGEDGIERCQIMLDPDLVAVRPMPRRPFQGWRYFDVEDAPKDLKGGRSALEGIPPKMRRDLAELGLL